MSSDLILQLGLMEYMECINKSYWRNLQLKLFQQKFALFLFLPVDYIWLVKEKYWCQIFILQAAVKLHTRNIIPLARFVWNPLSFSSLVPVLVLLSHFNRFLHVLGVHLRLHLLSPQQFQSSQIFKQVHQQVLHSQVMVLQECSSNKQFQVQRNHLVQAL